MRAFGTSSLSFCATSWMDRLDRHAVAGRRADQRKIAHAHQRHLQRARNRRRREREHVDRRAHLLEALLVHHAEPLLFIDDDQAEIAEDDVLLQEPVRADDDVHLAVFEPGDGVVDAGVGVD